MTHPPNETSRVAVRRFDGDGDVHRTISSTAVGNSPKSARKAVSCDGCSANASSPPATALRVVSAPALNSRLKNRYSSISERWDADKPSSSTVAFATTDNMSSVGAARFDAINSWPYAYIREPASSTDICPTDALREPPKSNCGSMAWNSQCRSDSGTPSRMHHLHRQLGG